MLAVKIAMSAKTMARLLHLKLLKTLTSISSILRTPFVLLPMTTWLPECDRTSQRKTTYSWALPGLSGSVEIWSVAPLSSH